MWESCRGCTDHHNTPKTYLFWSWKPRMRNLRCFQRQTEHWKLSSLHHALILKYFLVFCTQPAMGRPFAVPLLWALLLALFQKQMHNAVNAFCSQHDTRANSHVSREKDPVPTTFLHWDGKGTISDSERLVLGWVAFQRDVLWSHSGTEQPIATKLDLSLTVSYPLSKITFALIFYTVFLNKDISLPERKSLIQSSQCRFLAHVYL